MSSRVIEFHRVSTYRKLRQKVKQKNKLTLIADVMLLTALATSTFSMAYLIGIGFDLWDLVHNLQAARLYTVFVIVVPVLSSHALYELGGFSESLFQSQLQISVLLYIAAAIVYWAPLVPFWFVPVFCYWLFRTWKTLKLKKSEDQPLLTAS